MGRLIGTELSLLSRYRTYLLKPVIYFMIFVKQSKIVSKRASNFYACKLLWLE